MKKIVTYKTRKMLYAVKTLDFLVGSLDRIGSEVGHDPDMDLANILKDFMIEAKVLDKLAHVRSIVKEPFYDFPREGDYSFLETVCRNVDYWKQKE